MGKLQKILWILPVVVIVSTACGSESDLVMLTEPSALPAVAEEAGDAGKAAREAGGEALSVMAEEPAAELTYFVHVCGAVNDPGVYELPAGSRICDAVKRAGGLTGEANEDYWNQAQKITDGMQVWIPTNEDLAAGDWPETEVTAAANSADHSTDGRININQATREQLCTLPGIGPAKADSIIAYRTQHDGFASIEEVMQVEGIKEGLFAKIRDLISV